MCRVFRYALPFWVCCHSRCYVTHFHIVQYEFPAPIHELHTFKHSNNIVVRLTDASLWQSTDEGLTWSQLFLGELFTGLYQHEFDNDRAYLTTGSNKTYFTTDAGRTWYSLFGPTVPSVFGVPVFRFHPTHSDYLLWMGHKNCEGDRSQCHIEAYYSSNNGRSWNLVETYVRTCVWGKASGSDSDPSRIICESFQHKEGNQRLFHIGLHAENPLGLVVGSNFLGRDGNTKQMVDHIIRFTESTGYLVVSKVSSRIFFPIDYSLGWFPSTRKRRSCQIFMYLSMGSCLPRRYSLLSLISSHPKR